MQKRVIRFGSWGEKMYCLSSFSKRGKATIADYIRQIIIRVAKSRPIFRDEYAVIAFKLSLKHCSNPRPTLDALGCFDNLPSNTLGYGRLLPTGRFEIWPWEINCIEKAEGDFCLINKYQCCRYCFVHIGEGGACCKKCQKLWDRNYKDSRELKDLKTLTRKLERICNEKIRAAKTVSH